MEDLNAQIALFKEENELLLDKLNEITVRFKLIQY